MVTEIQKEHVAKTLTANCGSHEEWLAIVRYGLQTLLEDQEIFIELLMREAQKEADRKGDDRPFAHIEYAVEILAELGLRFVTTAG